MIAIVQRWAAKEKAALTKQLTAKDAADRFGGMGDARRNEAIALLVAALPVLAASMACAPYNEASRIGKLVLNVTFGWAILVLIGTLVFVVFTLVRIGRAHG